MSEMMALISVMISCWFVCCRREGGVDSILALAQVLLLQVILMLSMTK